MKIHHLNCIDIQTPISPAVGHCLLLQQDDRLVLVDAGIGLHEVQSPDSTLGQTLIAQMGLQLNEELTAFRQIEKLGLNPKNVTDCICSHLDPDHIGGVRDFEDLTIHVSREEHNAYKSGDLRYLTYQITEANTIKEYSKNDENWFGVPTRRIAIDFNTEIYLVPLFGHTLGHCGVAIKRPNDWLFYIGDAYYLHDELSNSDHPVVQMATAVAADNEQRIESLSRIRELIKNHGNVITLFSYHDPSEMS